MKEQHRKLLAIIRTANNLIDVPLSPDDLSMLDAALRRLEEVAFTSQMATDFFGDDD